MEIAGFNDGILRKGIPKGVPFSYGGGWPQKIFLAWMAFGCIQYCLGNPRWICNIGEWTTQDRDSSLSYLPDSRYNHNSIMSGTFPLVATEMEYDSVKLAVLWDGINKPGLWGISLLSQGKQETLCCSLSGEGVFIGTGIVDKAGRGTGFAFRPMKNFPEPGNWAEFTFRFEGDSACLGFDAHNQCIPRPAGKHLKPCHVGLLAKGLVFHCRWFQVFPRGQMPITYLFTAKKRVFNREIVRQFGKSAGNPTKSIIGF